MHLTKEELSEFLSIYPVPSEYKVMLPKRSQTIFDTLNGLNPFGYAKLTTFVVMCKAYGCELSVELFRGFFNLFSGVYLIDGSFMLEYGVLPSSEYGVLDLVSFVVFGECRHGYAVYFLMDTAYWLSEQ
nr:hypothetical protein [Tanacetum cinerariifolium]